MIETTKEQDTVDKKVDTSTSSKYIEAVGRRKSAVARVRITENKSGKGTLVVNEKNVVEYFPTTGTQITAREALSKVKGVNKFNTTALIKGGGKSAQAEALRHGLARALVKHDGELRDKLKKAGFLKRDPRAKERKKFGKKKARKSPQWSKR
ncbi:30S ribosomal protein S9 [bacterium]|nr:30S ribosomal protein S9 [bacterium]|tara:strand:+ start:3142 stop:3597 length:456 start_codon:yes stop_codon:yes gene_type:complete